MENLWLAQAACFFCLALSLLYLSRKTRAVQNGLDRLLAYFTVRSAGSQAVTIRESELDHELAASQTARRQAESRCADLEIANRSLKVACNAHAAHMADIARMKEAFGRVRENEHLLLEITAELMDLRQQREDVVRQLEVALSEDRQDGLLSAGLKELDARLAQCLERCRTQGLAARREYMELMRHHSDLIGLDHPLDELIWIRLQAEKAYGLALKLIEQLQVQMAEVEMRKRCYDSTMERLKHHAKRARSAPHAGRLPEHQDASPVRAELHTMPSPSDESPSVTAPGSNSDLSRVSILDPDSLRAALKRPRLPSGMDFSRGEEDAAASSMPPERIRELIINLEHVSSMPPAAPILIEDERDLAVFCRFLMRRVKLGEPLRLQLMGDHGPDYSDVTVGKLSWIAPHYQH